MKIVSISSRERGVMPIRSFRFQVRLVLMFNLAGTRLFKVPRSENGNVKGKIERAMRNVKKKPVAVTRSKWSISVVEAQL